MVHAIEAYTSKNANNNPMSKMLAVEALKKLGANIETACFEGQNLEAREEMLVGSMLAGMAFANSPVAAVHALAYPIGGMFHIPHGLSNALILKEVMRFNAPVCYADYSDLAPHVFPALEKSPRVRGAAPHLSRDLANYPRRSAFSRACGMCGIGEDDLPVMASAAMKQTRLLVNNPREVMKAMRFRFTRPPGEEIDVTANTFDPR